MDVLRAEGYECFPTEFYNSYTMQRKDLGGFQDFQAWGENDVIGVQVCSHGELGAHHNKLFEEYSNKKLIVEHVRLWLSHPHRRFQMHGWRKLKRKLKNGKYGKSYIWTADIIEYTLEDLVD